MERQVWEAWKMKLIYLQKELVMGVLLFLQLCLLLFPRDFELATFVLWLGLNGQCFAHDSL